MGVLYLFISDADSLADRTLDYCTQLGDQCASLFQVCNTHSKGPTTSACLSITHVKKLFLCNRATPIYPYSGNNVVRCVYVLLNQGMSVCHATSSLNETLHWHFKQTMSYMTGWKLLFCCVICDSFSGCLRRCLRLKMLCPLSCIVLRMEYILI